MTQSKSRLPTAGLLRREGAGVVEADRGLRVGYACVVDAGRHVCNGSAQGLLGLWFGASPGRG